MRVCRVSAFLLAMIAVAAQSTAARAEPARIDYRVSLAGIVIGTGSLTLQLDEARYRFAVDFALGAGTDARNFQAHARASGTIDRRGLRPNLFTAELLRGAKERRLGIGFSNGNAQSVTIDPPGPPAAGVVPIERGHRVNVIDPLSALIVPVAPAGLAPLSACGRTHHVFDGTLRYDVILFPSRVETITLGETALTAVVCRARSRAIAGHRRGGGGEQRALVWLAPVGDGRLMVPARIEVKLGSVPLLIEASEAGQFDSARRTATKPPFPKLSFPPIKPRGGRAARAS